MIENLKWHDADKEKPPQLKTVIVWARDPRPLSASAWSVGWFEDGDWYRADTSMPMWELVTHWASPCGPGA